MIAGACDDYIEKYYYQKENQAFSSAHAVKIWRHVEIESHIHGARKQDILHEKMPIEFPRVLFGDDLAHDKYGYPGYSDGKRGTGHSETIDAHDIENDIETETCGEDFGPIAGATDSCHDLEIELEKKIKDEKKYRIL